MKARRFTSMLVVGVTLVSVTACTTTPSSHPDQAAAAISLGNLPPGYRDWPLISIARLGGKANDLRAKLGNDLAIKAYRQGTLPFPDGAIIARLAWEAVPSEENNAALRPFLEQELGKSEAEGVLADLLQLRSCHLRSPAVFRGRSADKHSIHGQGFKKVGLDRWLEVHRI